jgi:hypothetical protein
VGIPLAFLGRHYIPRPSSPGEGNRVEPI